VILEFACAYKRHPPLLGPASAIHYALVPRAVSVLQVEEKLKELCLTFENMKLYPAAQWAEEPAVELVAESVPGDSRQGQAMKLGGKPWLNAREGGARGARAPPQVCDGLSDLVAGRADSLPEGICARFSCAGCSIAYSRDPQLISACAKGASHYAGSIRPYAPHRTCRPLPRVL